MEVVLRKRVIPKSTATCFIILPMKKTFVTGLARSYSTHYDYKNQLLRDHISPQLFDTMVSSFNESLIRFWPCPLSEYLGCIFCPVTCGASYCLPNICIKDAEKCLMTNIDYYNKYKLKERGV